MIADSIANSRGTIIISHMKMLHYSPLQIATDSTPQASKSYLPKGMRYVHPSFHLEHP